MWRGDWPGMAQVFANALFFGSPAVSVFPGRVIGSTCASSFSRIAQRSHYITACTLTKSPYVTRYTGGFSHFVTSMTVPVTSGWSSCRVGFAPTGTISTCGLCRGDLRDSSDAPVREGVRSKYTDKLVGIVFLAFSYRSFRKASS